MRLLNSIIRSFNKYNSAESSYGAWDNPFNPLLAPIALPFMILVLLAIIDAILGTRIISSLIHLLP